MCSVFHNTVDWRDLKTCYFFVTKKHLLPLRYTMYFRFKVDLIICLEQFSHYTGLITIANGCYHTPHYRLASFTLGGLEVLTTTTVDNKHWFMTYSHKQWHCGLKITEVEFVWHAMSNTRTDVYINTWVASRFVDHFPVLMDWHFVIFVLRSKPMVSWPSNANYNSLTMHFSNFMS